MPTKALIHHDLLSCLCVCVERTCQGSTRTVQSLGRPPEISADTGWHSCPCWLCPRAVPLCDASSLGNVKSINLLFFYWADLSKSAFFFSSAVNSRGTTWQVVMFLRWDFCWTRRETEGRFFFLKSVSQKKEVPSKHFRLFNMVL